MQRLIAAAGALALLAGGPATAQTIFPMIAAQRYCELRRVGVPQLQAIYAAGRAGYSSDPPVRIVRNGRTVDANMLLFTRHIYDLCRTEYLSEPIPPTR